MISLAIPINLICFSLPDSSLECRSPAHGLPRHSTWRGHTTIQVFKFYLLMSLFIIYWCMLGSPILETFQRGVVTGCVADYWERKFFTRMRLDDIRSVRSALAPPPLPLSLVFLVSSTHTHTALPLLPPHLPWHDVCILVMLGHNKPTAVIGRGKSARPLLPRISSSSALTPINFLFKNLRMLSYSPAFSR